MSWEDVHSARLPPPWVPGADDADVNTVDMKLFDTFEESDVAEPSGLSSCVSDFVAPAASEANPYLEWATRRNFRAEALSVVRRLEEAHKKKKQDKENEKKRADDEVQEQRRKDEEKLKLQMAYIMSWAFSVFFLLWLAV